MAAGRPPLKRPVLPGEAAPRAGRWALAAALAVGLGMIWIAFELGQSRAGHNRLAAYSRERDLREELVRRESAVAALREKVARLETDALIRQESYKQLESELQVLQARVQAQAEDLAFYQRVVSVDEKEGLRVQDLAVARDTVTGAYTVRMVLAQALRNDKRISGTLELELEGRRDGAPASLALSELTPGSEARLDFSFRYFQNLESELRVPDGFVPESVKVILNPTGKKAKPVEQSFAWLVQSG